jgi:deazaflavin-dependent oxidoreductase (nitroreductase family)
LSGEFPKLLRKVNEIELTVTGRKTGRTSTRPVWFVLDAEKDGSSLFLIPVFGAKTQWYKNVLRNPRVVLSVGGVSLTTTAAALSDGDRVRHVVELFTTRYGREDMERYYTNLTAAVEVSLTNAHRNP